MQPKTSKNYSNKSWSYHKTCAHSSIGFTRISWAT
jgi:hypothetical protein